MSQKKQLGKQLQKQTFDVFISVVFSCKVFNSDAGTKFQTIELLFYLYECFLKFVIYVAYVRTLHVTTGIGIAPGTIASGAAPNNMSNPMVAMVGGGAINTFDDILKATPPALVAFLANLPAVEGTFSKLYCTCMI